MARARVSVLCALLVCAPLPALAQSIESIGIRAQGVAGAFVAVADDATATWWNPAGLPHSQSFIDGLVEGGRGGHWGVAFGFPALGLSYYHLNISQIQPSASTAGGGTSRQDLGAVGTDLPVPYSIGFNQFGATVGQSLGDHFVVATTVKVMNALSDTRGDFDLGAMAAFGPVRAGLNVRNLIGGTFGTSAAGNVFELTRQARAGVAVTSRTAHSLDRLTLSLDVDLTTAPFEGRDERHVAGGAEAWLRGRRVALRGGAGVNVVSDVGNAAYGAVGITVSPFQRCFVDGVASWGPTEDRNRWGFDLRVTF
jgi:F plasmid transfer operon, TraF, protein